MSRQNTYMSGAYGKGVFGSADLDLTNWRMQEGGDDADFERRLTSASLWDVLL